MTSLVGYVSSLIPRRGSTGLVYMGGQVDMVFEVRDARIPFTSANADLDKIVGPSKARLIVLNKVGLIFVGRFVGVHFSSATHDWISSLVVNVP